MPALLNFLLETKYFLKEHGKSLKDIKMVCGKDFQIPIKQFFKLANQRYDAGYNENGATVAIDLQLVGNGFWIERVSFDGAEWWEFKQVPSYDLPFKNVKTIFGSDGKLNKTLAQLNEEE